MRIFEVEMSVATLRLLRRVMACVPVERFSVDELLVIKETIVMFDNALGEENE